VLLGIQPHPKTSDSATLHSTTIGLPPVQHSLQKYLRNHG